MQELNQPWDPAVQSKFHQMLDKIPPFLRPVAEGKVQKKAQALAVKANNREVTEENLIQAFFDETPFGFHGPMKTDMMAVGLDYTKYGYAK